MTGDSDEELPQPRRRVPPIVVPALAGVAVAAGVLVAVIGDEEPAPRPTSSVPAPSRVGEPSPVVAAVDPPAPLLRAVAAAYPGAELLDFGVSVPMRADAERNYQFLTGARRITVVVGPVDGRPEAQTTSRRDVLVVAKRSGYRIAVSVRALRGVVRPVDLSRVQRLVRDARLLASS